MPIIASAKKQLRQNKKRRARNDNFRELYREARVAFEKAIRENDLKAAQNIFLYIVFFKGSRPLVIDICYSLM